jgi:hypothetical protein
MADPKTFSRFLCVVRASDALVGEELPLLASASSALFLVGEQRPPTRVRISHFLNSRQVLAVSVKTRRTSLSLLRCFLLLQLLTKRRLSFGDIALVSSRIHKRIHSALIHVLELLI